MTQETLQKNAYGEVFLTSLSDSHQCLNIVHGSCTGRVSLYGGHVLAWQPTEEKPVLWLSDDVSYESGKAIRGGIPLCWPWFGPFEKNGLSGNHGFVRQSTWILANVEITEAAVEIVLSLTGEDMDPLWPTSFELTQTLTFSNALEQTLEMTNLGNRGVEYTAALHSYFCVSSPKNTRVPVLETAAYADKITASNESASSLLNCEGPLDRIYYLNDAIEAGKVQSMAAILEDSGWQRRIKITPNNTNDWVLWNPGKAVADKMSDVHENGEQEYVCLETANTRWTTIPAKKSVTIGQVISVEQY